ncbi:hypothetical protein ACROYT_G036341 [Oculina patagonica]
MCHCGTSFVPVGCYNDQKNPRLLRHYILNERDPSAGNYGGRSTDWANWHDYLPQFICRCAKKAKLLGYDVFGIEYYGECWADEMALLNDKGWPSGHLAKPDECVGRHFEPCGNTRYCAGKQWKTMVYRIVGECWSGNVTQETFLLQRVANQNECKNQCFEDCGDDDPFCTGQDLSNAVYAIGKNMIYREFISQTGERE